MYLYMVGETGAALPRHICDVALDLVPLVLVGILFFALSYIILLFYYVRSVQLLLVSALIYNRIFFM